MARKSRDFELDDDLPFMPIQYWLHVDCNGREFDFRREPDRQRCPTLYVLRFSKFEITYTYNVFVDGRPVRVHPRGAGWKLENGSQPGSSTWRREVV